MESLKFRNKYRIIVTFLSKVLWKIWIWVFWILCFVIAFLEAVFQGMAKNKSMKNKKINWKTNEYRNLGNTEACTSMKTQEKI